MSYQKIQTLLDTQLATVDGLPALTTENKLSKASALIPFVRSTLLPSRPTLLSLGTNSVAELAGLYQVDVYWPKGEGASDANAIADAIVAAFPRSVQLVDGDVRVQIRMVWRQAASVIDAFYSCPVIVEWASIN